MTKLYNANDGLTGRTGGPYLDIEQAKQAEIQRAKVEDREPNFDTMAASAGIQLVTAEQLLSQAGHNRPFDFDPRVTAQSAVDGIVSSDANALTVFTEVVDDKDKKAHKSKTKSETKPDDTKPDDTATETK